MRSSLYNSSKAFPLPLMLLLVAAFSVFCSKPKLREIVREHIKAVNEDDVEKNLGFFAEWADKQELVELENDWL